MSSFSLLHLTDMHIGMNDQDWMLPRLQNRLFDDLAKIHSVTGEWDLVLFSGDLTQRGSKPDFDRLDLFLDEMWHFFRTKLSVNPPLIVVPGNHDLMRPPALTSQFLLLKNWWAMPAVRDGFFSAPDNEYRKAVEQLFFEYSNWTDRFNSRTGLICSAKKGILPGDQAVTITKGETRIGIVALNSTWLQIDGDEYKGKLHVDVRQLLEVTDQKPDAWCESHDLNYLVTHQPVDWLSANSQDIWNSEINVAGRFDAHFFGHMHEPFTKSVAVGGGPQRLFIQGASACGLSYYGDSLERLHGYSVVKFQRDDDRRSLKIYPRRLFKLGDGAYNFAADTAFPVELDHAYNIGLNEQKPSNSGNRFTGLGRDPLEESATTKLEILPTSVGNAGILQNITYPLPFAPGHAHVRRVEQREFVEALTEHRAAWLIGEWGLGSDGFLDSIRRQYPDPFRQIYRLDLAECGTKDSIFDAVSAQLQSSFERVCQVLSNQGSATLILDNITIEPESHFANDIEQIVAVLLEFCPSLQILMRSRLLVQRRGMPMIALLAFDEADLLTYIIDHERSNKSLVDPDSVSRLHRHTDGIPSRVDLALKELEVVTLAELVNTDADVSSNVARSELPAALSDSINQLASSNGGSSSSRSFDLLKVLSLFPQGESLLRVKYFFPTRPFHPQHATELKEHGFVESISHQRMIDAKTTDSPKTLRVPRVARESVRDALLEEDLFSLNRRAAELYFGVNWSSGVYKPPPAYRFDQALCNTADLANANVIILRLLREAIREDDQQLIERVLGLAVAHLTALNSGSHHHASSAFCEDAIAAAPHEGHSDKIALIKHHYARSLRMHGHYEKAKQIAEEIRDHSFPAITKQLMLVNLAMIHQSLGDDEEAKSVAKEGLAVDRHSAPAMQAQQILLELNDDDEGQDRKLMELERRCRRSGALITANNIALNRAAKIRKLSTTSQIRDILQPVLNSRASHQDFYNQARATVELAEHMIREGEDISDKELRALIAVYHFVYNERFSSLFDRCHEALWNIFSDHNDMANLLSLFRYSSLHWRLRSLEGKEASYLSKLSIIVEGTLTKKLASLGREAAYFLARTAARLSEQVKSRAGGSE